MLHQEAISKELLRDNNAPSIIFDKVVFVTFIPRGAGATIAVVDRGHLPLFSTGYELLEPGLLDRTPSTVIASQPSKQYRNEYIDKFLCGGAPLIIFCPKHTFYQFSVSNHLFYVFYPSQIYLFLTFLSQIIPQTLMSRRSRVV